MAERVTQTVRTSDLRLKWLRKFSFSIIISNKTFLAYTQPYLSMLNKHIFVCIHQNFVIPSFSLFYNCQFSVENKSLVMEGTTGTLISLYSA